MCGLICHQIYTHGRPSRPDLNGPPVFISSLRGTVLPGFGRWEGMGGGIYIEYHCTTIKHEQRTSKLDLYKGVAILALPRRLRSLENSFPPGNPADYG